MPVLEQDDRISAETLAQTFTDPRITTYWDAPQQLGLTMRDVLGLTGELAWDAYLLYPFGAKWSATSAPAPNSWMHQMSKETFTNWLDVPKLTQQIEQQIANCP